MAENEDIEKVEEDDVKKSLFANKKLLIIIAVVLLLIIVGLGAFLFLGSSDDSEAAEDAAEVSELNDDGTELDDLPADQMTDDGASLELPELPAEEEPQQPASAADRLSAISGGLTNPEPAGSDDLSGENINPLEQIDEKNPDSLVLPEGVEMPDYDDPNGSEEQIKTPIMLILEEFTTPEQMAEEIAKLRRRVELNTKETTRLYGELGDMEDKLREKDRIIRAQDTAYLKGPKVSPKRNTGPVAPPEPTWEVSPQHTGP